MNTVLTNSVTTIETVITSSEIVSQINEDHEKREARGTGFCG